jgi:hypothetical protein
MQALLLYYDKHTYNPTYTPEIVERKELRSETQDNLNNKNGSNNNNNNNNNDQIGHLQALLLSNYDTHTYGINFLNPLL